MTIGEIWRRLVILARRDASTRDLENEMRLHVALRAEQYERSGMNQRSAAVTARRRFGNTGTLVETSRDSWGARWFDIIAHDARYAVRGLRRNPGFAVVVVGTLTLGLGVNAAVFSLLDRLFTRPPSGVVNPSRLHRVYAAQVWSGGEITIRDMFSYPAWTSMRAAATADVSMATYASDTARWRSGADVRFIVASYTDAAYWPLLGVRPQLGRTFVEAETHIETPVNVAIVSDAFWRTHLGRRRDVLGQTLEIAGRKRTIIGVAPPNFTGVDLDATDIWLPLGAMPIDAYDAGRFWYHIDGVPRLHALLRTEPSQLAVLDQRLTQGFRANQLTQRHRVDSLSRASTGSIIAALGPMARSQETLISSRLAWVSIIVLLIACANVTNLLLARMLERRREIAVRLALGVSRTRLATQLFVESLILGAISGFGALVAGTWASVVLRRLLMPEVHWGATMIDARVAVITAGAACVTAIAIGLMPVTQLGRLVNIDALKSGTRATPAAGRRLRTSLAAAQTAFAVVLVIGAALCTQSLRHVLNVDLGYDASRIVFAEPTMIGPRGGEDTERSDERAAGLREAARRMSALPEVAGVSLASHGPMAGMDLVSVSLPGVDSLPKLGDTGPAVQTVSSEYWKVIGLTRAARGRVTTDADVAGAPLVAVVNESMARTLWPGRDAVGQCLVVYRRGSPCRTVVGVIPDIHELKILEPPRMEFYVPLAQARLDGQEAKPSAVVVRANAGQTARVAELLRRTLSETLPGAELYLYDAETLLAPQLRPWRVGALLFSGLGVLALAVAAIGLYGVIAYGVRRRTHELGIRVALGARGSAIAAMVVGEGVRLVALGLVAGLVLSVLAARALQSLLYQTSLTDPMVVGVAVGVIVATAMIASLVPAARASRVDPMVALRSD